MFLPEGEMRHQCAIICLLPCAKDGTDVRDVRYDKNVRPGRGAHKKNCIGRRADAAMEVPSRIELLYTVLQTVA